VAVDGAGNVFFNDQYGNISKWSAASHSVLTLTNSGLPFTAGLAVDDAGNLYFAVSGSFIVMEWLATSQTLTNLITSGLINPRAVAVDHSGNVYISDGHKVKEWSAATHTLTDLVITGLSFPQGVAVDRAGNVYIADSRKIKEWFAASQTLTNLFDLGNYNAETLTVDSGGNVYCASVNGQRIFRWSAANQTLVTLWNTGDVPEYFSGIAVDQAENVYYSGSSISELPRVFLDPTYRVEPAWGGSDALPPVLPASFNLTGPFAPVSDSPWLTFNTVNNGVAGFSVTPNNGPYRGAHLNLLGSDVLIVQAGSGIAITGVMQLGDGTIQFSTLNNSNATCTVVSSTNLALPMADWTVIGVATYLGADTFQFAAQPGTNDGQRFFGIRSP